MARTSGLSETVVLEIAIEDIETKLEHAAGIAKVARFTADENMMSAIDLEPSLAVVFDLICEALRELRQLGEQNDVMVRREEVCHGSH